MNRELQTAVFSTLKDMRGLDVLKELFWQLLNYDRVDQPLLRQDWAKSAQEALAGDPILFASIGDFHILYCRLVADRLRLTDERAVVNRLLRDHPYALFIFSDCDQTRWHFVNVKEGARTPEGEKRKVRRLLRRIAIGPEERLRTATERISMLDAATIPRTLFGVSPLEVQRRHDEAFDVEAVTEAFFRDYRQISVELQECLYHQTYDPAWAHDYTLQLLNRLMFLYFIQRKRWLGGDPGFMRTFWEAYKDSEQPRDSFFEQWLSVLFFEAFNEKFQGERADRGYLPPKIRDALAMAPYLNGGLFTRNELDGRFSFTVPDSIFEMLFDRFNGQTPGFLEHYNFTISEDTPFDQEVAVDPEMIGKVYESLVNITFEGVEEEDLRGTAGIFYTPRVEIDLMCRLSLVDWLANRLGKKHKRLLYEVVFAYDPDEKEHADEMAARENLWPRLNRLLREVTVLDPACGSGSFLVGMLAVLDDLQARANAQLGQDETPYERRKRIVGQSLYGVDVMPWAVHVAELRLWLQLVVETPLEPAELKFRPLLPNLSFKIRPGDSLVQEVGGINFALHRTHLDLPRELKGRLTRLKGEKLKFYHNDRTGKFRTEAALRQEELRLFRDILNARAKAIDERLKEIADALRPQVNLFGEIQDRQMRLDRVALERECDHLQTEREQVAKAIETFRVSKTLKVSPFVWDIAFVEIFEGDKGGFDIVIGNPPYVRQERIVPPGEREEDYDPDEWREIKREYKEKLRQSVAVAYPDFFGYKPVSGKFRKLAGRSDLYIYFYLHGLSLLNKNGSFCFITSNSWLDVGYGKDLQEFLLKHSHVKMILDNEAKRSFAQADVNTIIALLGSPDDRCPGGLDKAARFVMFKVPFEEVLSHVVFQEIEEATDRLVRPVFRVIVRQQRELYEEGQTRQTLRVSKTLRVYGGDKWGGKYLRAPDIFFTILEKGKGKLVRLGDIARIRRGFTTGADSWFYLRKDIASELGIERQFLNPVLVDPGQVNRIEVESTDTNTYVILCSKPKSALQGTNLLEWIAKGETERFPGRGGAKIPSEKPTCRSRRPYWYSLQEREPAPILWVEIRRDRYFTLQNRGSLLIDRAFYEIVIQEPPWQETLCAILNSTLVPMFVEFVGNQPGGGGGPIQTPVIEVKRLLVPNYRLFTRARRLRLSRAFVQMTQRKIKSIFEELGLPKPNRDYSNIDPNDVSLGKVLPDRRALDEVVFEALGLTEEEQLEVYRAVVELVRKRLAKARSV